MIFAFDIFIHNADRWPLIWDNAGNANNLLIKIKTTLETPN